MPEIQTETGYQLPAEWTPDLIIRDLTNGNVEINMCATCAHGEVCDHTKEAHDEFMTGENKDTLSPAENDEDQSYEIAPRSDLDFEEIEKSKENSEDQGYVEQTVGKLMQREDGRLDVRHNYDGQLLFLGDGSESKEEQEEFSSLMSQLQARGSVASEPVPGHFFTYFINAEGEVTVFYKNESEPEPQKKDFDDEVENQIKTKPTNTEIKITPEDAENELVALKPARPSKEISTVKNESQTADPVENKAATPAKKHATATELSPLQTLNKDSAQNTGISLELKPNSIFTKMIEMFDANASKNIGPKTESAALSYEHEPAEITIAATPDKSAIQANPEQKTPQVVKNESAAAYKPEAVISDENQDIESSETATSYAFEQTANISSLPSANKSLGTANIAAGQSNSTSSHQHQSKNPGVTGLNHSVEAAPSKTNPAPTSPETPISGPGLNPEVNDSKFKSDISHEAPASNFDKILDNLDFKFGFEPEIENEEEHQAENVIEPEVIESLTKEVEITKNQVIEQVQEILKSKTPKEMPLFKVAVQENAITESRTTIDRLLTLSVEPQTTAESGEALASLKKIKLEIDQTQRILEILKTIRPSASETTPRTTRSATDQPTASASVQDPQEIEEQLIRLAA